MTGREDIDAACGDVADLSDVPATEHVERLSRAHETVSSALATVPLIALPNRGR